MHPFSLLNFTRIAVSIVGLAIGTAFAKPAPAPTEAPASPSFSPDVMYKILVGDIALQRGEPGVAARAYYEAAREAQDAGLARRATEVALFARQRSLALQAAQLWQKLDPSSDRARQMASMLALPSGGADLKADLAKLLADAAGKGNTLGEAFLQLNRALSGQQDKTAVYKLVTELAQPYPGVPEAQFAVALAGYNTGLNDVEVASASMRAVDRALELNPGWERAVLLKADLLAKNSRESAISYLTAFLADSPQSRPAAGALAQLYTEDKRYGDARAVFQRLLDADPTDRELEYAVAALSFQMRDYPRRRARLSQAQGCGLR